MEDLEWTYAGFSTTIKLGSAGKTNTLSMNKPKGCSYATPLGSNRFWNSVDDMMVVKIHVLKSVAYSENSSEDSHSDISCNVGYLYIIAEVDTYN